MSIRSLAAVLALVMLGQFAAPSARAQKAQKAQKKDTLTKVNSDGALAATAPAAGMPAAAPANVAAAPAPPVDSAPPPKKSGGMFGKLKSVAQNKKVQSITKAAVCTALPGGQYVMAAAEAAKNKQSVASGVANAQSCIPGMPGGMGGMGGLPGMGGKGVLASAAANAAGMGSPGAGGIAAAAMGGGKGSTAAQMAVLAGGKGMPNAAQIAAMSGGKGLKGATGAAVTAASIQSLTAAIQASTPPSGAGGAEMTTEASGQQLKLSGAVDEEIKKGKLTIKKIDWVHGSQNPSPATTQGFMDLMTSVGQAIKATGSTYRVDISDGQEVFGHRDRYARSAAHPAARAGDAGRRSARRCRHRREDRQGQGAARRDREGQVIIMRGRSLATMVLIPQLLVSQGVRAQERQSFTATLSMSRKTVGIGECNAVALDLRNTSGTEWPRGPNGALVSMADFDLEVSAPAARAAVGKYDGPSSFAVCACPKAPAGSVATVTATYPSKWIAPKARVAGASFTTTLSAPIIAGASSGNPPGCDESSSRGPWTVTVQPSVSMLPIGGCSAVSLTIRDSTGKDTPRGPAGNRVSLADFDMSATTANGADVVGKYDGTSSFSACACQTGTVGEAATITAKYPAQQLAAKMRVPGVEVQASAPVTLAAARGAANPAGCGAKQVQTVATGTQVTPPLVIAQTGTPLTQPVTLAPTGSAPTSGALRSASGISQTPATYAPGAPGATSSRLQTGTLATQRATNTPLAVTLRDSPTGVFGFARSPNARQWQSDIEQKLLTDIRVYRKEGQQLSQVRAQWSDHRLSCDPYPDPDETECSYVQFNDSVQATPGTIFQYVVADYYSDGSHTESPPTLWSPASIANPSGLTARDAGQGSVALHWQGVSRALQYRVDGTGLPSAGVIVAGTDTTLNGIPRGPGSWKVTAMFTANAADYAHPSVVSQVVRTLPPHTVPWLSKPNGLGSPTFAAAQDATTCADDNSKSCWMQLPQALTLLPILTPSGQPFYEAVYGNASDLGFGRRTSCASGMAPAPGYLTTVCYTNSHGPGPGEPGFADPNTITLAASMRTQLRTMTVIIKDATGMRFLVFVPTSSDYGTVSSTSANALIKFDTEGEKLAPHSCLACHGGHFDPSTSRVVGASMLPLDPLQLVFAGGSAGRAAQEESIRRINELITRTTPSAAVIDYINGLYGGAVSRPGLSAVTNYVPAGWSQQPGLYLQVVRPYCATCHLAAQPSYSFASWGNFKGNAALIQTAVCATHSMPHAEVPFTQFWTKDTGVLYLPGLLAAALGYSSC